MDRGDFLNRLDLEQQSVFDHEVEAVSAIDLHSLVLHCEWCLASELDPAERELVTEAVFIRRLQQPRPGVAVYFNTCADHSLCELFLNQHFDSVISVVSVVQSRRLGKSGLLGVTEE